MKVSNFQPIRHGAKTRKEFNIGNFKGVDLTSPTFDVASNRAIQCQNFLRSGDILEKRKGLNHLKDFDDDLLNIWLFKNYLIFHVGNDIVITNKNYETLETYSNIVKDVKISSIVKNDKLYIFGGIFLYILTEEEGSFTLTQASDLAYVPTTTTGIGASNLSINYDTNRQSYDKRNLLTHYHKNELTTGYKKEKSNSYEYILDADFSFDDVDDETPRVFISEYKDEQWQDTVLRFSFVGAYVSGETNLGEAALLTATYYKSSGSVRVALADTYRQETYKIIDASGHPLLLDSQNNVIEIDWETYHIEEGENGYVIILDANDNALETHDNIVWASETKSVKIARSGEVVEAQDSDIPLGTYVLGYILKSEPNKLVLYNDYGDYEQKANNVEVLFASKFDGENTSDYINHCTHAVQYTDAYSQNRVIVSGNEDYKNQDRWSENLNIYALQDDADYDPNVRIDDLTYFPAENQAVYGFHNKDIVGYGLHGDGKLLAFKENSDDETASIYIREGVQINQKYNEITGTYTYEYKLDLKASNKGSVPVNVYSITSYKGYVIYLGDDKKINIITNGDKSFATTIYAQPISHQIEKALESYELDFLKENAFIYAKNDYVYIVVGSSIFALIYEKTSSDDDYSFEYYLLNTNIMFEGEKITDLVWCDSRLLLGTSNGALFEMKNSVNDFYNDNRKIWLSNSEFTGNVITEGKIAGVAVGDYLRSDYYFTLPELSTAGVEANDFLLELLDYINVNEIPVYALNSLNEAVEVALELESGNITATIDGQFGEDSHLYVKQSDKRNIRVKEIDGTTVYYGLDFNNVLKDVMLSALGEAEHTGYIEAIHPVNAYYITAPMTMGTLSYYKNIYSYTISNDTNKNSELQLAIISNAIPLEQAKEIGENVSVFSFDLQEIDFAQISLAQDYIPVMAYTKYRNIFRQRFTDFVFYNKSFTNAILSKMTVIYTITSPVVGGD